MKIQFLVILFYCVYYVFAESSFIPKGQRAEIFELTDNEVPVFRITLPNEELIMLKNKANFGSYGLSFGEYEINLVNNITKGIIDAVNEQNFTEVFPGYNFKEILPELPINENGHPNIDYEKYAVNKDNINDVIKSGVRVSFFNIFNNDSYLNLIKVFYTLSNLDISSEVDRKFMVLIKEFGSNVTMDENGKFSLNIENNFNDTENDNINDNDYYGDDDNDPSINDYFGINYNYDKPIFGKYNDDYDYPSNSAYYDTPSDYYDSPSGTDYYDFPSSTDYDDSYDKFFEYFMQKNNFDDNNDDDVTPSFDTSDYYYPSHRNYFDFNVEDFENIFKNYDFNKILNKDFSFYGSDMDFKTKNATMIVEINNEKKTFNKITFSLGGSYSRSFAKPGYNIKIRGGKELYGRRQFKLRGDASEPSYMRSKLASDIRNRIGMPSLSANYATLYINDEYMGLFTFTDLYKETWIEYVYGEKDTSLLYKCNICDLTYATRHGFENENKEATDKKELYEFLSKMTMAKSASDVESFFDLDQFYKEVAIYLLTSSWDHLLHNYYIYKHNDKWIYLSQDYDLDIGMSSGPSTRMDKFEEDEIINKLVLNDDKRFNEILKEIVINVFNPATLFPHIDELKSFIRPYVKLDKTPDENGQYPGVLNKGASTFYTFKQWEDSTEFKNTSKSEYALKKFILLKYRIVCKDYNIECDPVYLDMNYGIKQNSTNESNDKKLIVETEIQTEIDISSPSTQTVTSPSSETIPTLPPTDTDTDTDVAADIDAEVDAPVKCLAELIGYPCCPPKLTTVYLQDEYGDWSYDFSKNEWCGLTKYEDFSSKDNDNQCWSEKLGYPCCVGCKVYEKDSDGEWGYELNQWCGIISSRC